MIKLTKVLDLIGIENVVSIYLGKENFILVPAVRFQKAFGNMHILKKWTLIIKPKNIK